MSFKKITLGATLAAVLTAGCASQHAVVASTPRSVQIQGTYFSEADRQSAFDLGEAACQKQGLHARLVEAFGVRMNATWSFDCIP